MTEPLKSENIQPFESVRYIKPYKFYSFFKDICTFILTKMCIKTHLKSSYKFYSWYRSIQTAIKPISYDMHIWIYIYMYIQIHTTYICAYWYLENIKIVGKL